MNNFDNENNNIFFKIYLQVSVHERAGTVSILNYFVRGGLFIAGAQL